jgi:hypothetical protein
MPSTTLAKSHRHSDIHRAHLKLGSCHCRDTRGEVTELPSSAKWGLAAVGIVIVGLILYSVTYLVQSVLILWIAVAVVLTGFAVAGVASHKGRSAGGRLGLTET